MHCSGRPRLPQRHVIVFGGCVFWGEGQVFCLGNHEKLDANTMADIIAAGYSRVLVYDGQDTRNIRGYLQV